MSEAGATTEIKGRSPDLSAYGGGKAGAAADPVDPRPSDFNDATDPLAPAPLGSRPAADDPAPVDQDATPPVFADNARKAIAAKSRAARAAANPDGGTAPVDKFNIPAGMRVEDDEDARLAAEEQRQSDEAAAAARRQPAPSPAAREAVEGKSYNLRVMRNDISVSRDELLRYAGVDAEDAAVIPEKVLIDLAQKRIATDAYLEDARAANKSARTAGAEPTNPSDQLQPEADRGPSTDPTGLSAKSDAELMEIIQFGSPEEASDALNIRTARGYAMLNAQQRAQRFDQDVQTAITDFEKDHPEIVKDNDLADFHRGVLLREISKEMATKIPGLPEGAKARIATDQQFAIAAYRAAVADGHQLRLPAQMFNDAAQTVRTRLGIADADPPDPAPRTPGGDQRPEPSATESREALKRGLIRQPGRSDSVIQQPPPQGNGARKNPSAIIRERFANRMNRG